MKTTILFTLIVFAQLALNAQWTNDPDNPMVVSNETCWQNHVTTLADGNSGIYVFWLDSRTGCDGTNSNDVYGQHYNQDGMTVWEEGGREILNYPTSINVFTVVRNPTNGDLIIGSSTSQSESPDSLRFRKINTEGLPIWQQDLLAMTSAGCQGTYILYITNLSLLFDGSDYAAVATTTYCGGSNGNRIVRFTANGDLIGPYDGEPEGNQNYLGSPGLARTYDSSQDIYLFYSNGNGAGAHGSCLRLNAVGDTIWGPLDVLEGTNGLNYQFECMSDENGIAIVFVSNGANGTQDLFIRKLSSNGTWAWNGNIVSVCGAEGAQSKFHLTQDDTYYYVCWSDGRPGIIGYAAIYAQRIDKSTGAIEWTYDGVEVFNQNTYIPYPACVVVEDGSLYVTNESTVVGFNAMKLNPDGTLAWTDPTVIANAQLNPFYDDYEMILTGANIVVAWAKSNPAGGADNIYIARVSPNTTTTYITENAEACDSYIAYGQTFDQSGVYEITLPGDTVVTLTLNIVNADLTFTVNGNILTATGVGQSFQWFDCGNDITVGNGATFTASETGDYALVVISPCTGISECVHVIVAHVESESANQKINLFPNPGSGTFTLSNSIPFKNVQLSIYNSNGTLVKKLTPLNGSIIVCDNADLSSGIYQIVIHQEEESQCITWMNQR